MPRRDPYLEHLAGVPLFAACTQKDLRLVAQLADVLTVPAGEVLIKEGGIGREFFVILEGTARVSRKSRKIADLGPGEFFGEYALLASVPRNATVVAQTPMELLVVEQRAFNGLLDETPGFARKLVASLARRLHELDSQSVH
jgi:CRP-like cAMP-binding protein